MTTPSNAPEPRPLYWSVRRELWENRSVVRAPLIMTGVFLAGYLLGTITLPFRMKQQRLEGVTMPFSALPALLILVVFAVGLFYCLDALHTERRDRSILFWKSLPVSDLQAVLAKASIPLVVLPLIAFAIAVTGQIIMLFVSSVVLLGNEAGAGALWARLPLLRMSVGFLYTLTAIALWHAPIYLWLMMVSAWAKRAVALWAVLPWFGAAAFERMTFGSTRVLSFLRYRATGWFESALTFPDKENIQLDPLTHLAPGRFLAEPALWLGLVFAAAFLAVTVWLRRNREVI
jgi:ABC-2 type transport system permease protein